MSRPLILITSDLREVGSSHRLSNVTPVAYVRAIERAGGRPMVLPILEKGFDLSDLLLLADGILLIVGKDYPIAGTHPSVIFGEQTREDHDLRLAGLLEDVPLPVLGICLGMQLLNLARGGSLFRDIHEHCPEALPHARGTHAVLFADASRLGKLLGNRITVNSSHHQAVDVVGQGLLPVGHSSDGLIEAVEDLGPRFFVGVQWHPERMGDCAVQARLWQAFVEAAQQGGRWP